jgi:hypothetical protein
MSPKALLRLVNKHLKKSGETPTAFSRRITGDPAMVLKMRRGRQLRYDLEQKVMRALHV